MQAQPAVKQKAFSATLARLYFIAPPEKTTTMSAHMAISIMHISQRLLPALLITASLAPARAQPPGDDEMRAPERSLALACRTMAVHGGDSESAIISSNVDAVKATPGKARVVRLERQQAARLAVHDGELGECNFPSGHRVRVKVGSDIFSPYGPCGQDPVVFMSVWVDGKKVESRSQFAGNCYRETEDGPDIQVRFLATRARVLAERCETPAGKPVQAKSTSCSAYPDLAGLPLDAIEYPPPGAHPPAPGTVQLLAGSAPVCAAEWSELTRSPDAPSALRDPAWAEISAAENDQLPQQLRSASAAVFDLDNDGKPERVILKEFDTHERTGEVLLTRYGSTEPVAWNGTGDAIGLGLLPCQLDHPRAAPKRCAPLDDGPAALSDDVTATAGAQKVVFDGRAVRFRPFFFQNRTYLGVSSGRDDTHFAVFEPLPGGSFRQACLLYRVPVNF